MSAVAYPAVLAVAHWDKQKGVLTKPTGVGDALKALKKLHDAVDWTLFDTAKLKSADDLDARASDVAAEVKKKFRGLADEAKEIATLAKKWEGEFKKAALKEASTAAAAVASAAGGYADDVAQAGTGTASELGARLAKARIEAKSDDAKDEGELPGHKVVRSKVLAGLRAVKANQRDAKPTLFMICVGKKGCTVYLSQSVGASHKTLLAGLLPGDSGFKYVQGECIWENRAFTFVSEQMPTGLAKRLQKGVFDLTGAKVLVRTRKPTGEAEETEGEADELEPDTESASTPPTSSAKTAASETGKASKPGDAPADAAKAFNTRLAGLIARLKTLAAEGSANATDLKLKLSQAGAFAAKKDFAQAGKLLDEADALATAKPAGANAMAAWQGLSKAWQEASDRVDSQLLKLQKALKDDEDEQLRAVGEFGLNGITGDFKVPLQVAMRELDTATGAARRKAIARVYQAAENFRKHIESDEGVAVCDENPYDIPIGIRKQLGGTLARMKPVLAALLK